MSEKLYKLVKQGKYTAQDRPFKNFDREALIALIEAQRERIGELLVDRPQGEWITIWDSDDPDTSHEGRCSECGRVSKRPLGDFCKWCGARMVK